MEANTFLSDHIIKALYSTLMHSLWQGILLAIIGGTIIVFTKKASAAYRYNLLTGAMAVFAVGVLVTFMWQLRTAPASNTIVATAVGNAFTTVPVSNATAAVPVSAQTITPLIQPGAKATITDMVANYFNMHYNFIVLMWFLIICAKSVQMAVGLHSVYHLKRTKVFKVSNAWENRLLRLAAQLHIRQAIQLMESGIAKVPMVIGHLKPLILIPVGLINSLNADEVEAILVHELAHIRRRDYLVNLMQSLMEIVFFFNPAVLWISQLIKTERENCCDDIALARTNSKVNYINALVSCQELQTMGAAFAMAFPGGKHTLLDRVKRMASNSNQSLNMFEKTVLAVCLVALGLGVSAFTAREDIKKAVKSIAAVIHHEATALKPKTVQNDTTKKKQAAPSNDVNGWQNQAEKLSPDTLKATGSPALDALIHNVDSLRQENSQASGVPADTSWKTRNKTATKSMHDIGMELYHERLLTDTDHLNISLNERELIVNGVRMPEYVHSRIYRQFGRKGESGNYRGNYSGRYAYNYVPSDGPEPTAVIVPDFGDTLVKYGVIKDKRHIHAIFNSQGLIINGVKQPDDVFGMLFKKYGPNTNITYTNNGLPDKHMEQQAYWAEQQRKMIDQMQREGLITDRDNISFTLTTKTFVINGLVQNGEVFERYRREYVPADAGDNWNWNYHNIPGDYSPYGNNSYRNSGSSYRLRGEEERQKRTEIDKKLVADLMQDGLITDPNNVSFSMTDKKFIVNGKTQSADIYQKYKDKYRPDSSGTDWSWSYSHHE